jgi:hypothetical protein
VASVQLGTMRTLYTLLSRSERAQYRHLLFTTGYTTKCGDWLPHAIFTEGGQTLRLCCSYLVSALIVQRRLNLYPLGVDELILVGDMGTCLCGLSCL